MMGLTFLAMWALAVMSLLSTGCESEPPRRQFAQTTEDAALPMRRDWPAGGQAFDFARIKQLAQQLRPGMSRSAVMLLLGSPAVKESDQWIYHDGPAGLLPVEGLVVEFEGRRYVSHHGTIGYW